MNDDFVQALRDAANATETRVPLPGASELFVRVIMREGTFIVSVGDIFAFKLARVVVPRGDDIPRAAAGLCKQARARLDEWAEALRRAEARIEDAGGAP